MFRIVAAIIILRPPIFSNVLADAEFSNSQPPATMPVEASALSRTTGRSDIECAVKCEIAGGAGGCSALAFDPKTGDCLLAAVRDVDFSATSARSSGVFRRQSVGGIEVYSQIATRRFRVIQRRSKGSLSFARHWIDYENGFGDGADFWIGLKAIHQLTGSTPRLLRVEAVTWTDVLYVAEYSGFSVAGAGSEYTLTYGAYLTGSSNTTQNSLDYHKGMKFSTMDRDNDAHSGTCSQTYCGNGGWWYRSCSHANPSGIYYASAASSSEKNMNWYGAGDSRTSLKSVQLMLLV